LPIASNSKKGWWLQVAVQRTLAFLHIRGKQINKKTMDYNLIRSIVVILLVLEFYVISNKFKIYTLTYVELTGTKALGCAVKTV
jgi:hypothetical protein